MAGPLRWHWALPQVCSHQTLLKSVPVTKHSSKQYHNWPWHHDISHKCFVSSLLLTNVKYMCKSYITTQVIDIHLYICSGENIKLFFTSYLSQRSCAPFMSPSLRWVRMSAILSLLFRNSIQAMPLWMTKLHIKKSHISVHNEQTTIWKNLMYNTGHQTLSLLEMFWAVQAAECCQPSQGLLDL